jgi:16S rRNA processing protein RimM
MARLELGHVSKAHGLRGDLILHLITDRAERTAPGAELFLGRRPDDAERFVVARAQPYQAKWLVGFEGVTSREAAEALRGRTIFGDELDIAELDDDSVFVHQLIGKRLVDQHGTDHGPVRSVLDNPASDLLELDDGRLVPLTFYVAHDEETITVDVPTGLLDDEAEEAR